MLALGFGRWLTQTVRRPHRTNIQQAKAQVYQLIAIRAITTCALVRVPFAGTSKAKAGLVRECKKLVAALRPDGAEIYIPAHFWELLD